MRRLEIGGKVVREDSPHLQDILRAAYQNRQRPMCLCKSPGVPTYIARVGVQYLIKRMPLTGDAHDTSCPSHEAVDSYQADGDPANSAIRIDPENGTAMLRLGFSLSRAGPRAVSEGDQHEAGSVAGDAGKLSLIGLLHYLWHEAELTSWTSRWSGKRHWPVLRWHLLEAARQMTVRGKPLTERLFIPEPFRTTAKAAIERRRTAALATIRPQAGRPAQLMLLIGEVKSFDAARNGRRLVAKHMPGFEFLLDEAMHRRLRKRFAIELDLWEADPASHLITIATFSLKPSGLAAVEEIALMLVAENWVPCRSLHEKQLVAALARISTRSVKLLPRTGQAEQPSPTAILWRSPRPLALYIVPPAGGVQDLAAIREKVAARSDYDAWIWDVEKGGMPPLPVP